MSRSEEVAGLLWEALRDDEPAAFKALLAANPDHDVNFKYSYSLNESCLLHLACIHRRVWAVQALLARPEINVNSKDNLDHTPLLKLCRDPNVRVLRLLLRDPRVDATARDQLNRTILWRACGEYRPEVVECLLASGRPVDLHAACHSIALGTDVTALQLVRTLLEGMLVFDDHNKEEEEVKEALGRLVSLLTAFEADPEATRWDLNFKLGYSEEDSADLFAETVFLCEGLLRVPEEVKDGRAARFFSIAGRLPLELQMLLCNLAAGSSSAFIPTRRSEPAFRSLARLLRQ